MKNYKIILMAVSTILLLKCSTIEEVSVNGEFTQRTESFKQNIDSLNQIFSLPKNTKLDNAFIDTANNSILIEFNKYFSVIPLRDDNVNEIYKFVRESFGDRFENYGYKILSMGY